MWIFGKKKVINRLRDDVQKSFDGVKEDLNKVGTWIDHFDGKHKSHDTDLSVLKDQIFELQEEIELIKSQISIIKVPLSKQTQTSVNKQTSYVPVQTAVQTAVQTDILAHLTIMERAIVWALLNTEVKLSYEDLAALLGKDKSTVRGQINTIKQKSEGLIEEYRESNGKKRLYIPDEMRDIIVKNVKVRVKNNNSSKKLGKKQEKSED
jgi:predicted transcriptional regulator